MNIVLYVNSFFPSLGGKEFVVHHLANALWQLGHKVRVLGPQGIFKHRHIRMSYPIHRWPTLRGVARDHVCLAQLALDTAIWGCDVVHAHATYPNGYAACRLRRFRKFPLVVTPHGADIQTIPELGHGLRLDAEIDRKIVAAVRDAEIVTAISNNIETVIAAAGVAKERIRLIPNGVDLQRFDRGASADIREWLGLPGDARMLVTVGKYNPRKGLDYAVRCMPAVLAAEPRARLVIVGQETDVLEPLIEGLGLQGKVVLTGGISPPMHAMVRTADFDPATAEPDRLAELLCTAEVYLSAGIHRNSEGLSLAVLEGMAAGLPIAATAISGNTDVVVHGENGLLAEPADEAALAAVITQMLGDETARARMARGARETASRYGWIPVAQRYVEAYEEAIARRR